eukprot:c24131_g2_i1 orf=169-417(+)
MPSLSFELDTELNSWPQKVLLGLTNDASLVCSCTYQQFMVQTYSEVAPKWLLCCSCCIVCRLDSNPPWVCLDDVAGDVMCTL